jgi:hypothetical protein
MSSPSDSLPHAHPNCPSLTLSICVPRAEDATKARSYTLASSTQELLEQQHRCLTLNTPVPLVRSTTGSDEFGAVIAVVPLYW